MDKKKKYTDNHEWLTVDSAGVATIGISKHAIDQLGDIVFVELPEPNSTVDQADAVAVIESVKVAADVYTPLAGVIIEVNSALEQTPEILAQDPENKGWIFKVKIDSIGDIDSFMDHDKYREFLESE